jgi:hypothetical protein
MNMGKKIVIVDSGRAFVKSLCAGKSKIFQSAIARLPEGEFRLSVKTVPDDIWVKYGMNDFLLGNLAVRQKPDSATQDRNPDKTNEQNILQTIVACSLFAGRGEEIILLANCPARDWKSQKKKLEEALVGKTSYSVFHKAGDMAGTHSYFSVSECHVLPEAETALFGYCYDLNLNLIEPEVFNSNVLVVDIGDQTCNYVSFNPGGDPYDAGSGSLDLGMFNAYAKLQRWLEEQGKEMTQAELVNHIIYGLPIMRGNNVINYQSELRLFYDQLESDVYNQLSSRLKLSRYQNMILAGGGPKVLSGRFIKRYEKTLNVIYPIGSQLLNCYGAQILYMLSR